MIHLFNNLLKILLAKILGKKIILSRCACLGLDVLRGFQFVNRQKFRIDLPWIQSPMEKLCIFFIATRGVKNSIYNLITQQSFNLWGLAGKHSDYFVMDTYSELTDRLYIYNNVKFCCHRSDLLKNFKNEIGPGDLIDADILADSYKSFFYKIRTLNPDLKIIVMLFPVKYDNREIYNKQHEFIRNALRICSDIEIIELQDSEINKDPTDDYPYHFDSKTIDNFRLLVLNAMENS